MSLIDDFTTSRRMTLEEFKALPEGPPKSEFEAGVVITMTQPSPDHQDLLIVLIHSLRAYVRRNNLGRVFFEPDVYLPGGQVYVPDAVYLSNERLTFLDPIDKAIHGTPDLCVEVLSSRPTRDRVAKFKTYFANELKWYWLADPISFDVEEYQWTEQGYVRTATIAGGEDFQPALFPGLIINLKKLLTD